MDLKNATVENGNPQSSLSVILSISIITHWYSTCKACLRNCMSAITATQIETIA